MTRENKIAVLAGNIREFNLFAQGNDNYVYIDFPEKAMGREFSGMTTVGTWYERKDAHKLKELVESIIILTLSRYE